tara:strand:+ start:1044 stop:1160 length:117 start_codon:yes stop_codon:yes gene_type:complete
MNKFLSFFILLSIGTAPVLSWGEAGCPFSKKGNVNQDN